MSTDTGADPLDKVISIVIVLFILSVITEKFTNLSRTYPKQFRILGVAFCVFCYVTLISNWLYTGEKIQWWWCLVLFMVNTLLLIALIANMSGFGEQKITKPFKMLQNVGKDVVGNDDTKEKEVTLLSFLIGFCVAFAFKVNLITIFNGAIQLGWSGISFFKAGEFLIIDPTNFGVDAVLLFSFLLTAFFLAFGSKFFHDLLDNLLEVKNLKRKLVEKQTYEVTTIKEFDDQLAKTTYQKNASAIASLPGVSGVSFGRLRQDEGSGRFGLKVFTSKPEFVLSSPLIRDANGKPVAIQVEEEEVAVSTCPSATVMNIKPGSDKGTIGIWVKEVSQPHKIYLLTCYHVVKEAGHDWNGFVGGNGLSDQVSINGSSLGRIVKGIRTPEIDAALIDVGYNSAAVNNIPAFNTLIKSSRPVLYFDDDATNVNVSGTSTNKGSGLITGLGAIWKIDFQDGSSKFEMVNLVEIQNDGRSIARSGDSGALIFTPAGEALGIVVATTPKRTLAMPIHTILTTWDLEIL